MSATVQTLRAQVKEANAEADKLRELLKQARPYVKFALDNGKADTAIKVSVAQIIIEIDGIIARKPYSGRSAA